MDARPEDDRGSLLNRLLHVGELPFRLFDRIPRRIQDRIIGLGLFAPGITVLGLARWLTPDASGVGTHQQLGLGGCSVLTLTGWPCPMCGMTTTFSHLAHFELIQGLLNQPFGLYLFSATLIATALGLSDLLVPRGRWRKALRWVERRETAVAVSLLVGMFAGWVYKSALMHGFLPWSP